MKKTFATILFSFLAFACTPGSSSSHTFSVTKPNNDETTIAVVEVVNGSRIADHKWVERLASPSVSLDVTVSGPALLVAIWWGDGKTGTTHDATPDNGFTVIDSLTLDDALIQCIVAVKGVTAGTHNVTWKSESGEGAQLWLIAVDNPNGNGAPLLGGHVLEWDVHGTGGKSITTPAIKTNHSEKSGSVIIVATGHFDIGTSVVPTDSDGNTFTQIGTVRTYTNWPGSGTAVHATFLR